MATRRKKHFRGKTKHNSSHNSCGIEEMLVHFLVPQGEVRPFLAGIPCYYYIVGRGKDSSRASHSVIDEKIREQFLTQHSVKFFITISWCQRIRWNSENDLEISNFFTRATMIHSSFWNSMKTTVAQENKCW